MRNIQSIRRRGKHMITLTLAEKLRLKKRYVTFERIFHTIHTGRILT